MTPKPQSLALLGFALSACTAQGPQVGLQAPLAPGSASGVKASYRLAQATPARQPVLFVLPQQGFLHREFDEPRRALEAAGWPVVVASEAVGTCTPFTLFGYTGQAVAASVRIQDLQPQAYSALVVPGGWGASRLAQTPLASTNTAYRRQAGPAQAVEQLLRGFRQEQKPILGICHGMTVLAWARDAAGQAFLAQQSFTASQLGAPPAAGVPTRQSRDEVRQALGSTPHTLFAPNVVGSPATATDDVVESGLLLSAQDDSSAAEGGRRLALRLQALEAERLEAEGLAAERRANARRVLLVGANEGVYWPDFEQMVQGLQAQGLAFEVAAGQAGPCQVELGPNGASIEAQLALASADPARYGAIVFLGGWGMSALQPAHPGTYAQVAYRGQPAVKAVVQRLVQAFHAEGKWLAGLCHGASVLAWSRVPNAQGELVSPLAGLPATTWPGNSPWDGLGENLSARHLSQNGAVVLAPNSVGDPTTAADDVVEVGHILTAQQELSAPALAQRLAQRLPSL